MGIFPSCNKERERCCMRDRKRCFYFFIFFYVFILLFFLFLIFSIILTQKNFLEKEFLLKNNFKNFKPY